MDESSLQPGNSAKAASDAGLLDDAPVLSLDLPPPAAPKAAYRVLARKYRPQSFNALIGQDAMVQTLANAIRRNRLAHAFLMTGVRGVGKTSTARLIAKALNCVGRDGTGGATIDPCGQCEPCIAIAEGRHIDVIEMDAASHNGIDDVREINDAVRYAAVTARYKIYIIDEVHALSKPAFQALLKTLEEPPPHVKFLFATTEADKLPVTVLSRCMRFDLRRIPTAMLAAHFAGICAAEHVAAEPKALRMIAEAAEGSVRDGLSILDQAIAHADLASDSPDAMVTAAQVLEMLGLADKSVQRRLFAAILAGDGGGLLELVMHQFALGVEPVALMRAMMELTHRITVAQLERGGEGTVVEAYSAEDRAAVDGWARGLGAGQLHRLWQLLLKGHDEVRGAPDPLMAAQMALLRCLHAADLPDPASLARRLDELAARPAAAIPAIGETASAPPPAMDWAALVRKVEQHGRLQVAQIMRDWVRVVALTPGQLRFALAPGFSGDPSRDLREGLADVTKERWQVERVNEAGGPALRELAEADQAAAQAALRQSPLVAAAFAAFPDAQIIEDSAGSREAQRR